MGNGQILRNVFSVVAGVLTGAALFMVASFILLLVGFSGVHRDMDDHEVARVADRVSLLLLSALLVCSFLGGYVTARISTKQDRVHAFITGIVLAMLLAVISDFSFAKETVFNYVITICGTLLGAWVAIRLKRKKDQPM